MIKIVCIKVNNLDTLDLISLAATAAIQTRRTMESLRELPSRFKTTDNRKERNALALMLTETGDPQVQKALIELIDRPELVNERGTLLYCLGHFDCSEKFLWLVRLVCLGNWEIAHTALLILEEIALVDSEEVEQGSDLLLTTVKTGIDDEWRAELIADLLPMFK